MKTQLYLVEKKDNLPNEQVLFLKRSSIFYSPVSADQ